MRLPRISVALVFQREMPSPWPPGPAPGACPACGSWGPAAGLPPQLRAAAARPAPPGGGRPPRVGASGSWRSRTTLPWYEPAGTTTVAPATAPSISAARFAVPAGGAAPGSPPRPPLGPGAGGPEGAGGRGPRAVGPAATT